METFTFSYVTEPPNPTGWPAHVGVVGSGDLEVLFEPLAGRVAEVTVQTSVDGYQDTWREVLTRFFSRYPSSARIVIHDFGATPGVVFLRLSQAAEASHHG